MVGWTFLSIGRKTLMEFCYARLEWLLLTWPSASQKKKNSKYVSLLPCLVSMYMKVKWGNMS